MARCRASPRYVALAGLVGAADGRLPAAGAALQTRLPRRLPFADGAGRLPHRRRRSGRHRRARRDAGRARSTRTGTLEQLARSGARGLPHAHLPTLGVSGGGRGGGPRLPPASSPRCPALLVARRWRRDGGERRVRLRRRAASPSSGRWLGGLPRIGLPAVDLGEIRALLPIAASCFLMIVAQSAATARASTRRAIDERSTRTRISSASSAANAAAALSGTFVVNGSPTQTAMVERSGGPQPARAPRHRGGRRVRAARSCTGPLQYLPRVRARRDRLHHRRRASSTCAACATSGARARASSGSALVTAAVGGRWSASSRASCWRWGCRCSATCATATGRTRRCWSRDAGRWRPTPRRRRAR